MGKTLLRVAQLYVMGQALATAGAVIDMDLAFSLARWLKVE
jgi:hypothetical protein